MSRSTRYTEWLSEGRLVFGAGVYPLAAQLERQNCVAVVEGEDDIEGFTVVWLLHYISILFRVGLCS